MLDINDEAIAYLKGCRHVEINPEHPESFFFVLSQTEIKCKVACIEVVSDEEAIVHAYRPLPFRRFGACPSPLCKGFEVERFPDTNLFPELEIVERFREQHGRWPVLHELYDDDAVVDNGFSEETRFIAFLTEFGRDFADGTFVIAHNDAMLIAIEVLRQFIGVWE